MIRYVINGTEYSCEETNGFSLLLNALKNDIPMNYRCIGGCCGNCRVHVTEGAEFLSETTRFEEIQLKDLLNQGYRLACQCKTSGDVILEQNYEKRVTGKSFDSLPTVMKNAVR